MGQGDKDFINVDLFKDDSNFYGDVMVWGDWAYGPEDDPYDKYGQYGDPRLEKKL